MILGLLILKAAIDSGVCVSFAAAGSMQLSILFLGLAVSDVGGAWLMNAFQGVVMGSG